MKEKEEDLSTLSRRIILMEEEVGDRGRQRGYRRQGQTEREGIGVDREVGDRGRQRSRRQEQTERQEIGVDREVGDRGRQRGRRQGQTEKQEIGVDREVGDRGRQRGMGETVYFLFCFPPGNKKKNICICKLAFPGILHLILIFPA